MPVCPAGGESSIRLASLPNQQDQQGNPGEANRQADGAPKVDAGKPEVLMRRLRSRHAKKIRQVVDAVNSTKRQQKDQTAYPRNGMLLHLLRSKNMLSPGLGDVGKSALLERQY